MQSNYSSRKSARFLPIQVQAGYALVTSMLLLLMLATMGVSMYGNVNIQEQMAFNMRVKNRTFIAADSMLQSNWTLGKLTSARIAPGPVTTAITGGYNQENGITITGSMITCYKGESIDSVGYSMDAKLGRTVYKLQTFEAEATANETMANATTAIALGGFIVMGTQNGVSKIDPTCL